MEVASDQTGQKRVRRRTFLIDRKFQLKYTLIIVLVGVVVSAFLGYFVYDLSLTTTEMATMDQQVGSTDSSDQDAEFLAQAEKEIRENFDNKVLYGLILFVVVMALALFIWGIFITHRVAGPVFIISRYLAQIRDGDAPQTRPLRKGDELKSFFDVFSGMLDSLKQRNLEEAELMSRIASELANKEGAGLAESAKALEEMAASKKSWAKIQSE